MEWSFQIGADNDPSRLDTGMMELHLYDSDNEDIALVNNYSLDIDGQNNSGTGSANPEVPEEFGNYGIRVTCLSVDGTVTKFSKMGHIMVGD